MTSKELVKKALENWRFPVLSEAENTIVIRYQMNYIHISSLTDESKSIAVLLTGIFTADDEHEERLGLKTCNELNMQMMQTKFYLDNDNDLVVSSEFFYSSEEEVEALLRIAMNSVVTGKVRFGKKYKEALAEDRLIQELNEDE